MGDSSNAHTSPPNPASNAGLSGEGPEVGTTAGQGPVPSAPHNVSRMHRTHSAHVLGYVPAVAHFGKEVYVDCYAQDPVTGLPRRKRYKFNRRGWDAAERRRQARDFVQKLNDRLRMGYNPWASTEAPKSLHTVREAVEQYISFKQRTTRHSSPHNYKMTGTRFLDWCTQHQLADGPVANINQQHAHRYFDDLHTQRGISNNTHNIYLTFVRGMFKWMIDRGYRSDNPFRTVARLRKTKKKRVILSVEERRAALEWFRQHDPPMVLVCLFTFHTLVRPRQELSRVRAGWIDFDRSVLRIDDGADTKSGTPREPAIPASMLAELERAGLPQVPKHWFAVGAGLQPGPDRVSYNLAGLRWNRMREALGWPDTKHLYSLRDSGIVQLIRDGVSLEVVMRQADHKNIATTNQYVQHAFPNAQDEVMQKATSF